VATLPLIIFAKKPVPGQVKTRLIPALGVEGASALYRQLLELTLRNTGAWPGPRYLYCAPDSRDPFFASLAAEHGLRLRDQTGSDLGERMASALADFAQGALLIGSDCPVLTGDHLEQAATALQQVDTAIIPSEDGGYVLIGQRQPSAAPFCAMQWSHADVLKDTRARLQTAGLSWWEGAPLWDLDEPADLPRFEALGHG
jgi:uncharacterized protein